jgi:cholesterol transport system auxiliary component
MGSADLRAEQKVGGRFETENGKPGSFRVRLVIFVAALGLYGCGATQRETFDLSGASIAANTRTFTISRASAVAVAEPSASQLVNSNRLVIRGEADDLAYLADAQWADRLPHLVQASLIARLRERGVDAAFPGAAASYQIATELRRFEIDVSGRRAVVEIAARLSSEQGGRLVGAAVFLGQAPADHTTGPEAVRSLDQALDRAADRLVAWVRGRI